MKKGIKILASLILVISILTDCKKYDEGPLISLRTKKARLAGDWKIEKILYDGGDSTAQDGAMEESCDHGE